MSSYHTRARYSEADRIRRDLERSHQAEQEARKAQARAEQQKREIQAQYNSNISSLTSQINSISSQHDSELKRLREEHNQSIANQAQEFSNDINNLREEHNRDINKLTDEFKRDMNRLDRDMKRGFDDFNNRFIELANKEVNKQKRAEKYIVEIEGILARVSALNPQKYDEGGYYNQMKEQLAIAKGHCEHGDYEASLGVASVRFTDINAFEQRLIIKNIKFNTLLSEDRGMVNELKKDIALLIDGKPVHTFTHEGQKFSKDYDIDYWTHGRFKNFHKNVNNIEKKLKTAEGDTDMGIEQLEAINEQLTSWTGENGELHLLDEEGKNNQISSIAVEFLTARLYDAMEEHGYILVDSGRHNNDNREQCNNVFEDTLGNKAVLIVAPSDNPSVTQIVCEVFANDNDEEVNEEIKDTIQSTVIAQLQGEKVEVSRTVRQDDCSLNTTPEAFEKNAANTLRQKREQRRMVI